MHFDHSRLTIWPNRMDPVAFEQNKESHHSPCLWWNASGKTQMLEGSDQGGPRLPRSATIEWLCQSSVPCQVHPGFLLITCFLPNEQEVGNSHVITSFTSRHFRVVPFVQWRPMKATLFDALILTPVSGAKLPFVAQVLRAKLGNLMAARRTCTLKYIRGQIAETKKRIEKRVQNWALACGKVTQTTVRLSEQLSIITRKRPFNESEIFLTELWKAILLHGALKGKSSSRSFKRQIWFTEI